MVTPSLRTRSIGTKVSEEEYAQLERAAQMAAKTLGEWCHEVMLTSANRQPAKATRTADEFNVLMAELVALEAILLNVLFKQANGEPMTAEDMQRLIDRADSDKLREARERLEQAQKQAEDCPKCFVFPPQFGSFRQTAKVRY